MYNYVYILLNKIYECTYITWTENSLKNVSFINTIIRGKHSIMLNIVKSLIIQTVKYNVLIKISSLDVWFNFKNPFNQKLLLEPIILNKKFNLK